MAAIIRIKRSEVAGNPSVLGAGVLAYSALAGNQNNGGDRLYIGMGTEDGNGDAVNHYVIGGKYFTDMLSHAKGTLTANSAILVDSQSKVNNLKVDNLDLAGSTLSTLGSNANLVLSPHGTGKVSIAGNWTLPRADGTNNYVLTTDGSGSATWQPTQSVSVLNIAGDTGTDAVTLATDTLTFDGTGAITAAVTNNKVAISIADATTTTLGAASFSANTFSVTSGAVDVKTAGISNTQLANSSVTIGSTTVSLGGTSTSLAGVQQLTVDQIDINGNTISSTTGDINLSAAVGGILSVNNVRLAGLAEPTQASDAATKSYVDSIAQGLHVHAPVQAATTGTLASITGAGVTYSNGTSGVGATLTLAAPLVTLDGYTLQNGDRILVKDEASQAHNGIYTWATGGTTLTRATDFDSTTEVAGGDFLFVMEGTVYGNTGWVETEKTTGIGTSPIIFQQFSGAGAYTAGAGLTQTGTTFDVGAGDGIQVNANSVQLASSVAGNGLTYATGVLNVGGTTDRITVAADSVDIASTYVGQSSITTVGALSAGSLAAGFSTVTVGLGGTGQTSFTTNTILYGNGSGAISSTAVGTWDASTNTGQLLSVNSSGVPTWTNTIDGGTYVGA